MNSSWPSCPMRGWLSAIYALCRHNSLDINRVLTSRPSPITRPLIFILLASISCRCQHAAMAADSICATVKIAINQELTLEREGFDAHMRINNGLPNVSLNDVAVDVKFSDAEGNSVWATSNPDNTNALFYFRVDSMAGIDDVEGGGVVAPTSIADIHWLIIPAQGAGGSNVQGVLYYVGATLSYRIGDTTNVTEVIPDYIYVKPMPDLALDYFLPGEVYGDDAFTPEVEPPVPFSLGLRVKNIGYGVARNFKLESAQPRITENEHGLLVGFAIHNCEVNGVPQPNSMLLNFGNLPPEKSAAGRWTMTTSLSGTFTDFTASFTHADELGGMLTSLIKPENLNTHMLLRDVLVDIPGRDQIRDYLTAAGMVYESEGIDSEVANVSDLAQLAIDGTGYLLTLEAPPSGFIYMKLPCPPGTEESVPLVARSDGKNISGHNAWIAKERKPHPPDGWDYFFNLFDVNPSNHYYTVEFVASTNINHAPVLAVVDAVTAFAGENLCVNLTATDQDDDPIVLHTGNLPVGARFLDLGDGAGIFSWTPSAAQIGNYSVSFSASDGVLTETKSTQISVVDTLETGHPGWWSRRAVIMDEPAIVNDYAAVNQGQVKHIAWSAWEELELLPGGAGFSVVLTNAHNYSAVNIGQLKQLAIPFYDRLSLEYPWIDAPKTNDHAIANIGQVKNLFGFNPWLDSDGDGMPDWWEILHGFNPANPADALQDANDNGILNVEEYMRNTNPN